MTRRILAAISGVACAALGYLLLHAMERAER